MNGNGRHKRKRNAKNRDKNREKRRDNRENKSGRADAAANDEVARMRRALRASIDYRGTQLPQTEEEIDIVRYALVRRMRAFMGAHRRCPEPVCRRRGDCVGFTLRCRQGERHATPEEQAEAAAFFRKALTKIADERGWR